MIAYCVTKSQAFSHSVCAYARQRCAVFLEAISSPDPSIMAWRLLLRCVRQATADRRHVVPLTQPKRVLARSDFGHIVVFAQSTQILVQLLYLLLVCFHSFLLQSLFQPLPSHLVVSPFSLRLLSSTALSYRSFYGLGRD